MNKCSNCEKLEKEIEKLTTLTLDDLKKIDEMLEYYKKKGCEVKPLVEYVK